MNVGTPAAFSQTTYTIEFMRLAEPPPADQATIRLSCRLIIVFLAASPLIPLPDISSGRSPQSLTSGWLAISAMRRSLVSIQQQWERSRFVSLLVSLAL
jgi:hypothetical protein